MTSVLLSEGIAQCSEDEDEYCECVSFRNLGEGLKYRGQKIDLLCLDRQYVNVFSRDTGLGRFDISIK